MRLPPGIFLVGREEGGGSIALNCCSQNEDLNFKSPSGSSNFKSYASHVLQTRCHRVRKLFFFAGTQRDTNVRNNNNSMHGATFCSRTAGLPFKLQEYEEKESHNNNCCAAEGRFRRKGLEPSGKKILGEGYCSTSLPAPPTKQSTIFQIQC